MSDETTTIQLVQLPDGSYAMVLQSITYGEAVIILLLVALLFLKIYEVWRRF
jgi:hypothetical protein